MASQINNLELYEFLKEEVECGIQYNYESKNIEAWAWISYCQLEDFIKLVGKEYFDEGGIECKLLIDSVGIELNDIIEYQDDDIFSYKGIFNSENDFEEAKNLYEKYGRKEKWIIL